jgi:hypothetical protein
MSDVAQIEEAVERLYTKARTAPPEERARLFDGVMDFFPAIGVERATRYLEELVASVGDIPDARRAQVLEEALMLAGHLGSPELGRRIFETLEALVAGLPAESAAEIAPVMGGMLRTLRRVGLRDEAARLLLAMQKAAEGVGASALVARLHIAAALAYLGSSERARPVFDEAASVLAGDLAMPARLELTRALTRAVTYAPEDYALAVLDKVSEKLDVVTDSFNTNSHVCLSVLAFVEALVLGYASEDLAVGERGRQWLDDDEYLIRRRIHREMGQS